MTNITIAISAEDSDTADDNEERRRRKRKRRSRWAPENDKVDIPPVVVPPNPPPRVGITSGPGVLGAIPVAPPTQERKLPGIDFSRKLLCMFLFADNKGDEEFHDSFSFW